MKKGTGNDKKYFGKKGTKGREGGWEGEREGGREGGSNIQSRELHTGYKN